MGRPSLAPFGVAAIWSVFCRKSSAWSRLSEESLVCFVSMLFGRGANRIASTHAVSIAHCVAHSSAVDEAVGARVSGGGGVEPLILSPLWKSRNIVDCLAAFCRGWPDVGCSLVDVFKVYR
jgi:hypothetical protein